MKKYILYFLLALIFASCSQMEDVDDSNTSCSNEGIVCTVKPLELSEGFDDVTRSSLSLGSGGMNFAWNIGDMITVYPEQTGTGVNSGEFTLGTINANNSASASFTGGGFNLTKGKVYYTFSKCTNEKASSFCPTGVNTDSYTNITMSYAGQRMTANRSTTHLGKYDFMSAKATSTEENNASFTFQHLGLTLRLVIQGLPADNEYTKITMYDADDNLFRELTRTTNITSSSSSDYLPYLNTPDITDESVRFSLDLGENASTGITVNGTENLVAYMEIPPMDFSGKTIAFHIDGKKKDYYCLYTGEKLSAGHAYQMTMTAKECNTYNVKILVNHDWTKGNAKTTEVTRAVGDPGITDDVVLPQYIYAFVINKGHLVQKLNLTDLEWTTSDNVSTLNSWKIDGVGDPKTGEPYNTVLTPTLDSDKSKIKDPRLYIVASNEEITSWKKNDGTAIESFDLGTSSGTSEDMIKSLAYDYSTNIKNIYATPYAGTNFTGDLSDDVKGIHLYHVCSKVDINWKNTTTSALSGNVSVTGYPTANLSYFQPTSNPSATTTVSPTTVSVALTTGTAYTGRAVFYLPQPSSATYNVTVGSTTHDITFTKDNVYTSWFLGQIKIK